MSKVILIVILCMLCYGSSSSQEYRGLKRIDIPETCPVTKDTLFMMWVDSCIKAKMNFYKKILNGKGQIPFKLSVLFIDTCHEEYKQENILN